MSNEIKRLQSHGGMPFEIKASDRNKLSKATKEDYFRRKKYYMFHGR